MRTSTTTLLLGAALSTLAGGPAMAYSYWACNGVPTKWNTNGPTLRADPTSFPTGYWRDGLQKTINLTNQNPSNFFFGLVTDAGGVAVKNGQNEVWGSTDPNVLQGAPALAYTQRSCFTLSGTTVSRIDESDVIFDYRAPFQWTADELKSSIIGYTGTKRQLQSTGTHEFGHALGLLHVNTEYNIMGNDFEHIWANGPNARGYLGEDASDGTVFLYRLWSSNYQDLGVSHWKYFGTSGEYSDHVKTRIYNSSGVALPTVSVNGETGYLITRGRSVQVEFTYENNGKSTQTVNTGWYVSTNDVISSTDRLLTTSGMTLARDNVTTLRRTLTVPSNLVAGANYWIGTIVNKGNTVSENILSNNASYIPVRVQ